MSQDPIAYFDRPNVYQYVLGNPIDFVDPSGLLSRQDCIKKLNKHSTDISELNDHFSRYHCGNILKTLNDFLLGGCRGWRFSLADELGKLAEFYLRKCNPLREDVPLIETLVPRPQPVVEPQLGVELPPGTTEAVAVGAGAIAGYVICKKIAGVVLVLVPTPPTQVTGGVLLVTP